MSTSIAVHCRLLTKSGRVTKADTQMKNIQILAYLRFALRKSERCRHLQHMPHAQTRAQLERESPLARVEALLSTPVVWNEGQHGPVTDAVH